MKNLQTNLKNLLATIAIVLFATTINATHVDIRMVTETIHADELYVNIQIKNSDNHEMVLAGQNYRIYYNAAAMELDQKGSKSLLNTKRYASIEFTQVLEHMDAQGAGELSFDEDLGYANFSIDLKDLQNGGEKLNAQSNWKTVARLKFRLNAAANEFQAIWGREGKSDTYATAFVNVAEWKAPYNTVIAEVNAYGDYHETRSIGNTIDGVEVTVGPNPTTDFIQVNLSANLDEQSSAVIYDINGREVKRTRIGSGENQVRIDVSDLNGASYLVELSGSKAQSIHRQVIMVTR